MGRITRQLKVWGGLTLTAKRPSLNGGLQARTVVCAASQKEAVEMLNAAKCYLSLHEFRGYWAETGNAEELSVAKTRGVWTSQADRHGTGDKADWKRLWPTAANPEGDRA